MKTISKISIPLLAMVGIFTSLGFHKPMLKKSSQSYYYVIAKTHRSDDKIIYLSSINKYEPSCGVDWKTEIAAKDAFVTWLTKTYDKSNSFYDGGGVGGVVFGYSEKITSYNEAKRKLDEYIVREKNRLSGLKFVETTYTYSCE